MTLFSQVTMFRHKYIYKKSSLDFETHTVDQHTGFQLVSEDIIETVSMQVVVASAQRSSIVIHGSPLRFFSHMDTWNALSVTNDHHQFFGHVHHVYVCCTSMNHISPDTAAHSCHLSKAVLGPVLDLRTPGCCSCMDAGLGQRFGWSWWSRRSFPPFFAPVCDGEASLAPVVQVDPGQEVCGDMLGFDPWAGAHLGFSSLVEGHEPLATSPVVPVDH